MGKNDIEDALKRLDRLTQEEARMAAAQLLKVTDTTDNRIGGIVDNVEELKRSWSPNRIYAGHAGSTFSQGISYDRIFVDGSRHQIHLRIIILRVTPIMKEPRPGFSREQHTRNGSQQVLSHYSGFMENVCPCPILPSDAT
jgi:hypothetical protein